MTHAAPVSSPPVTKIERSHRSLGRDIAAEWLKLWTVRSTYWTLVIGVLAMVSMTSLFGMLMRMPSTQSQFEGTGVDPTELFGGFNLVSMGVQFAQLAFIVLAALVVTNEYSSGTIRITMATDPRRVPILAAKSVVVGAVVFVAGVIATALAVLMAAVLSPAGTEFKPFAGEGPRILIAIPLYLTAISLLALAVGTILRNTAATIAIVLGWLLVVESVLSQLPVDWLKKTVRFLPGLGGSYSYSTTTLSATQVEGFTTPAGLQPWHGFAVLCGWMVITWLVGALLLKRRDV